MWEGEEQNTWEQWCHLPHLTAQSSSGTVKLKMIPGIAAVRRFEVQVVGRIKCWLPRGVEDAFKCSASNNPWQMRSFVPAFPPSKVETQHTMALTLIISRTGLWSENVKQHLKSDTFWTCLPWQYLSPWVNQNKIHKWGNNKINSFLKFVLNLFPPWFQPCFYVCKNILSGEEPVQSSSAKILPPDCSYTLWDITSSSISRDHITNVL